MNSEHSKTEYVSVASTESTRLSKSKTRIMIVERKSSCYDSQLLRGQALGGPKTSTLFGDYYVTRDKPLSQIFIRDFEMIAPLPSYGSWPLRYDIGSDEEYQQQQFEIYYAGRQSQRNGIISSSQAGALDEIILNDLYDITIH